MTRGRAGRRSRHRKTGWMGGRAWVLTALTAAAVICGAAELVRGRGRQEVRVSHNSPGTGAETGSAPLAGREEHSPALVREQSPPMTRKILVVDVKDSVEVEIPAFWQEHPDSEEIRSALVQKAAQIAEKWDRQPVDSQMESFDKTTGNYLYSKEADGRILDQEALAHSLVQAVREDWTETVKAVFQSVPPKRTQAQAKEQYRIIGTFTTAATDNKNRNQNISLAVDAIDGMVLGPGEEFSFNSATGNRTGERGYQPAGAYRNGMFIEEPGGGVCQVSTTLYHAIVDSGLKATERNAHSFAPSYVHKGQDAMVSFDGYAGPDLRFVNTEKTSVGLRASFHNGQLRLSIVGPRLLEDGTAVSLRSEKIRDIDPPEPVYEENPGLAYGEEKVVEQARPGSVWKTYRQTKKNGEVLEETHLNTSSYKAKPARIQRNSAAKPQPLQDGAGQEAVEQGEQQNVEQSFPESNVPEHESEPDTQMIPGPPENAAGADIADSPVPNPAAAIEP